MDDAAAAQADQVGGGVVGGFLVIDEDAGAVLVVGNAIEKDEGGLLFKKGLEVGQGGGIIGQGDKQTIHPAVKKGVGVGAFLINRLGGLADDEVIAFMVGDILHPGDDGGHEVAIDSGDDHADRHRAPGAEVARKMIATVSKFLGEIGNTFLGLFADDGIVLQCPADGGDG